MNSSLTKTLFLFALVICPTSARLWGQTPAPETQPVLLQMIRDDAIHTELQLSEDQSRQVIEAVIPLDGDWFRARILPAKDRQAKIASLTQQLSSSLQRILDAKQLQRLDQLQNQALGTRMIVRDETVRRLGLADSERQELFGVFLETDREVAELQKKMLSGDLDSAEATQKINKIKNDERDRFVSSLSNEQKRNLSALTGPTFSFSAIKRMYPFAPELTTQGGRWLQGNALELEKLRGKVVAVHFYAYQCINCIRNLPHYNGWHEDYADDGLVVIGIQTPETSNERIPERVAAALKEKDIRYPVLMDTEKANWNNWSNTMWPTVYLIDKKGFLRRWWHGEMNWKGTPGEKQMRETIEQLLAEDA